MLSAAKPLRIVEAATLMTLIAVRRHERSAKREMRDSMKGDTGYFEEAEALLCHFRRAGESHLYTGAESEKCEQSFMKKVFYAVVLLVGLSAFAAAKDL